jgi:hypothetical protein
MEDNQIIDKPKMYQAIGIISGVLESIQLPYSNLVVGDYTYLVTVSRKAEARYEPGQLQNFKVYPLVTKGKLGFSLLRVIKEAPEKSGMTLKGCWVMYEEEPRLIIYRNNNNRGRDSKTVLQLMWEEAPVADGKYWEIEAEVNGEQITVIQAIGPFDPPRKSFRKKPKAIKSELLLPTLKSAKTSIALLASKASEPSESELTAPLAPSAIAETTSEPIDSNASQAIEESTVTTKAVDVNEPIASSEIKVIAIASKESIKPKETEVSPVVVEAVIPKAKRAGRESSASTKPSITEGASVAITPENAEPKKTKEKVKSSRPKKSMSLTADGSDRAKGDRLFLGKQLPSGK